MESAPTNLLFITTDQQRFDSLPCYGLDFMQTPNLDRLAAEGVVFERCYTPAPVCVPCRMDEWAVALDNGCAVEWPMAR